MCQKSYFDHLGVRPHYVKNNVADPVAGIAFHQREVLPGTNGVFSVDEGNGDKRGHQKGVDVGGSVVVMPGIVVTVVDNVSSFIAVGRDALHGFPHVVLYKSGLEFERRQRPPLIKTG